MALRFTQEIVLDRPIEAVWRAFDNPENLKVWQPTLVSFEPVSGTPGQPGAVSRLTYQEGKRIIVLMETVTDRQQPNLFAGTYDSGMGLNNITARFSPQGDGATLWRMEGEFISRGIWKLITPLFAGVIRKRTREDAIRFKTSLESGAIS